MPTLAKMLKYQTIKLCNCAACGKELVGESHRAQFLEEYGGRFAADEIPDLVARHVQDRPYCDHCVATEFEPKDGGNPGYRGPTPGERAEARDSY
jgi:hypothetical protein